MKLLSVALAIGVCSFTTNVHAQTKTESFNVSGNCGMCKSKIEKAAKEAGAKSASWDADSHKLTVTYKSSLTNAAKIQEKVAEAGYDNAGVRASDAAYNKLHGCCKYERSAATTMDCCKGDARCEHHDGAAMDCCKDGKCTKQGHEGKDCCKEGKCTMEGHDGKNCCKK